jgi:biotin carboxylase
MTRKKDIIIFVNAIRPKTFKALRDYEHETGRRFTPIVFVDSAVKESIFACNGQYSLPEPVEVVTADFSDPLSIRQAIAPYEERIFAVTSQYENCIDELQRLLPYLPYIPAPTEKSLNWSTEKKLMRKILEAYDPELVPKYMEVADANQSSVDDIEKSLEYPVIVKPSGLEGSLLVTRVENRDELEYALEVTFSAMQKAYDTWIKRQQPAVLIEEFMSGDMYTVDVYVDPIGKCYSTPVIETIVGRKVGFDDFFGYRASLPSGLDDLETANAQKTAEKACKALGLRSVTAHVELMRTPDGWRVIELGPRIGGYRYELYDHAYGINHIMNDILNRAGEEPIIPTKLRSYSAVFNIYPRKEGTLKAVYGLDETRNLKSFVYLNQRVHVGEETTFAKNGGDVVVNVMLSNPDKTQLEADVATMEHAITFDVSG